MEINRDIDYVRNSILELLVNHKDELNRLKEVYPEITDEEIWSKMTHYGQRLIQKEVIIITEIEKILGFFNFFFPNSFSYICITK